MGHEAFSFVGSALAWMTEVVVVVVVGGLLASHANLLNFLMDFLFFRWSFPQLKNTFECLGAGRR